MQQMIESLLTGQEVMLARLDANHKEIMAKIDAETEAMRDKRMEASRNAGRKERTACQEMKQARLECEELISAGMKPCHETPEADTEKIHPDPRLVQFVVEHQ
jgi:hypothetical protein